MKDNKNIVNIASSDELDYIITEYFYSNFSGLNILEKKEEFYELKKLIGTFINLFKSNNYDYIKFGEILKRLKYGNDYIKKWIESWKFTRYNKKHKMDY